jgi:tetratricopeptide (TPR) repeat protein
MRHWPLVILSIVPLLSACAAQVRPSVPPAPTPQDRMASADEQVRAGCLDCLDAAFRRYASLQSDPGVGAAASEAAARVALLIAVRENELGLVDSGHVGQARSLIASPAPVLETFLDISGALSSKPAGSSRGGVTDTETLAIARIARNHLPWAKALRDLMPADVVADYLWLSLACGEYGYDIPDRGDRRAIIGAAIDMPLLAFKNASTCSLDRPALQAILDRDPRFVEAHYFLGLSALSGRSRPGLPPEAPDLEGADAFFRTAYAWRQNWPALTLSIANVAMTAEDFDRAVEFFDKTLALTPDHIDAMMGTIRALTYQGRHVEAIAAVERLLATNRNPGEGRYWRALNNEQLQQHDDAWIDIERAAAALVNADVPKLAGIIAINRHELDVARQRLELAQARRPTDCETAFYLQAVLTEQRQWGAAAGVSADAGNCFDGEIGRLSDELESLRASKIPVERRDRQIARRERQIAADIRMRATSWFDAAAANFNLARYDESRRFAGKLVDDQQFADRVRDLLARLSQP